LSFESQDAMQTLGSHRVYIRGIHKIKSFVSKGVMCTLHTTVRIRTALLIIRLSFLKRGIFLCSGF